jgi:hypothetical protein
VADHLGNEWDDRSSNKSIIELSVGDLVNELSDVGLLDEDCGKDKGVPMAGHSIGNVIATREREGCPAPGARKIGEYSQQELPL